MRSLLILVALAAHLCMPDSLAWETPDQARLLIRFRPSVSVTERKMLVRSVQGAVTVELPQLGLAAAAVPASQVNAALLALRQSDAVLYAEPDARAWVMEIPNDPAWEEQWGPQKINAPLAWSATKGSSEVIIAVVDSGMTLDHPDLANQIWVNSGEVPANGIDDDGNDKVDDISGWHFYLGSDGQTYMLMEDANITDDLGHGTHVAGIAAAETANGIGMAGMAGSSRLMTVKVLDEYGLSWYSLIVQGIVYAVDNGAQVINLSLGGAVSSQALQDAVDYAAARGAVVVAAAGNNGEDVLYPAACDHVLAVAATDADDQWVSWSNVGPQLDVAAPGVDIYSTWPWQDGYRTTSGTSMAAPHASGLAALARSLEPTWSPVQISQVITSTSHDVDETGWDPATGWGRIDAGAALSHMIELRVGLAQEISPSVLRRGLPVTYTISLSNSGDTMTDVVISDTLPAGVAFTAADSPGVYDSASHEVIWQSLTIAPGAQITMRAIGFIDDGLVGCTQLVNVVSVYYNGMKLPAVNELSNYVQPCTIHLPLIMVTRQGGDEVKPSFPPDR